MASFILPTVQCKSSKDCKSMALGAYQWRNIEEADSAVAGGPGGKEGLDCRVCFLYSQQEPPSPPLRCGSRACWHGGIVGGVWAGSGWGLCVGKWVESGSRDQSVLGPSEEFFAGGLVHFSYATGAYV